MDEAIRNRFPAYSQIHILEAVNLVFAQREAAAFIFIVPSILSKFGCIEFVCFLVACKRLYIKELEPLAHNRQAGKSKPAMRSEERIAPDMIRPTPVSRLSLGTAASQTLEHALNYYPWNTLIPNRSSQLRAVLRR